MAETETKSGEERSGAITSLAELPSDGLLDANTLAHMLGRCKRTIQRAIRRGELPQPIRFMGRQVWMVKTILEHLDKLQDKATRQANRNKARSSQDGD